MILENISNIFYTWKFLFLNIRKTKNVSKNHRKAYFKNLFENNFKKPF